MYSGLWSEVSTRQTLESFIQRAPATEPAASKTRGALPTTPHPHSVFLDPSPLPCHTAPAATGQWPLPLLAHKIFQTPDAAAPILTHLLPQFAGSSSEQAMCPRATAQHCGAAMASVCSFVEEEYIDLDLSSCGELEFRVRRSGAAADELLCRGKLQPPAAAAPHKAAPGGKAQEVDVVGGCGGAAAGRRSAATVAPLQHSHSAGFRDDTQPVARLRTECSRRRKAARTVHAKLLASRAFFRSLFARTSCSDDQCRGAAEVRARTRAAAAPYGETKSACKAAFGQIKSGYGYGYHSGSGRAAPTTLRRSIEQEKLMDEEELAAARQRKSFSGVIKWRHAAATTMSAAAAAVPPAAAPAKPLSSSSARRSSGVGVGVGGGVPPALKRSSSARSESEGLIQGAIAYCKRSQQQLGLARKSVSDAALYSASAPSSWPSNPALLDHQP